MGKYILLPYFRGHIIMKMRDRKGPIKKIKDLAIKYNSER